MRCTSGLFAFEVDLSQPRRRGEGFILIESYLFKSLYTEERQIFLDSTFNSWWIRLGGQGDEYANWPVFTRIALPTSYLAPGGAKSGRRRGARGIPLLASSREPSACLPKIRLQ